jgi:chemotaxis protein methyltransferase CheR
MAQTLSSTSFQAIAGFFENASGIKLLPSKAALVQGRLQRLASDAGFNDLDTYVSKVVRGEVPASEVTKVVDRLTTNETYFYREPEHFKRLRQKLNQMGRSKEVLVWSAASSSGEEAYSAAMLMAEVLGDAPWRVYGTDLSSAMVKAAQRGLYSTERAANVPEAYLKKYCLKGTGEHQGQILMTAKLRSRVEFLEGNLMKDLPDLPMFDVIFLRNVLIYFENEGKSAIVRRVLTRLKDDGELYTGHAESLANLGLPIRTLTSAVHGHA